MSRILQVAPNRRELRSARPPARRAGAGSRCALASSIGLPQHPDEQRPQCPVLLAVDQQLSESAALRMAPELADPVGALEVREHEYVEELGAGSGAEGFGALPESALEFVGPHVEQKGPVGLMSCDPRGGPSVTSFGFTQTTPSCTRVASRSRPRGAGPSP
jgi:hypothetical protein